MTSKDLIARSTRCPEFEKAYSDVNHPCHKLVNSQNKNGVKNLRALQIPEPFNGNPKTAEILFIGPNPAPSKAN